MSNRRWRLVAALLVIAIPAWSQVDRNVTPVLRVTLLSVKSVTLNPTSVTGGATVNGVVTTSVAAPGPVTVKIASSSTSAEVPQSVTIQQGATSATFIVQTRPVWMNPSVVTPPPTAQISAQLGNDAPVGAALTILPPYLTSVTLSPATVGGGANSTGTLTLSGPAPPAGIIISLSTPSNAAPDRLSIANRFSPIGLPAQVSIPAGAKSAPFTVTTHPVAAPVTYEINAAWGAFGTKTATLTVAPPEVASLTPVNYSMIFGGQAVPLTLNLTGPAAADGLTINLKTSLAFGGTSGSFAQCGQLPSVPATVLVPSGTAKVNFTVTASPGYGVFWVHASTATKSVMLSISVDQAFNPSVPTSIKGGTPAEGRIRLTGPAPPANCPNRYSLQSSNPNYAQVPPYVDVAPGATEGVFSITTSALPASSAAVNVTISATGIVVGNNVAAPPPQFTKTANVAITP